MLKTTYFVYDFNYMRASIGALCVMIKADANIQRVGGPDSISNIVVDEHGKNAHSNPDFFGAGICNVKSNSVELTINGSIYTFNMEGIGISTSTTNYILKLAEVDNQTAATGNAIQSPTTSTMKRESAQTRGETKSVLVEATVDYTKSSTVMVNSLNARDQFAVQALRGIMEKNGDVVSVADNEKYFYCQQAYQWADNMMKLAAQTRATLEDYTHSTEQSIDITELETNTDKLLNNILFALESTQATVIDGESKIVSERIINPELNSRIDEIEAAIRAHTTAFNTAISDLATAINNQTTAINNQNAVLSQIKTAIENLELSPVINNNIVVPSNNNTAEE